MKQSFLTNNKMENQTYDTTPKFTLNNRKFSAKVLDIYDADTITVCIFLEGFNYVKLNVRLYGIDTPELRGDEKTKGIEARNYLIKLLTNIIIDKDTYTRNDIREMINIDTYMVEVLFGDFDKYGRPLGTIYKDGVNINQLLVTDGYAKEYFGGTK